MTSTVSQADADSKVQNAFKNDTATKTAAQAYANKNGDCADDDDTPSYDDWSYYCSGCDYRRSRNQTNPCSSASNQDELVESDSRSCGCGCDNTYHMDNSRCNNGNSEEHYSSECDPTGYWQNGGEHCCNPYDYTIYTNEVCKGCSGSCGDVCAPSSPMKVVSAGEYCRSTTQAASSAAYDVYSGTKANLQAVVDAKTCPQMVCNDYVEATATKQGCPSNCTAPTASAYWVSGGNNGAWCECNGDKAALTAAAQASANALAQEKANALECDCPPTKNWSANAYVDGDPCNGTPSGTSALRVEVEITYSNECTTQKSLTVTASSSGTTIGSTTVTIPTGSGTKKATISFDRGYPCNSINISGRAGGQC